MVGEGGGGMVYTLGLMPPAYLLATSQTKVFSAMDISSLRVLKRVPDQGPPFHWFASFSTCIPEPHPCDLVSTRPGSEREKERITRLAAYWVVFFFFFFFCHP